jgi:hypothetical protein
MLAKFFHPPTISKTDGYPISLRLETSLALVPEPLRDISWVYPLRGNNSHQSVALIDSILSILITEEYGHVTLRELAPQRLESQSGPPS